MGEKAHCGDSREGVEERRGIMDLHYFKKIAELVEILQTYGADCDDSVRMRFRDVSTNKELRKANSRILRMGADGLTECAAWLKDLMEFFY